MFDTIAAISSGNNINQAISIIRVTGPDAFKIVKKIFTGKVGESNQITYGFIKEKGKKIDEVLVAWFKGTKNFIGEDTVEINAHGGIVVTNLILELLLVNGARLAEPGEFSRRAFLNGKIDLIKAEAINDLIHAKTKKQANLSARKLDRKTSNFIEELIDRVSYLIAGIEVNIDYPEYDDVDEITRDLLWVKLEDLELLLEEVVKQSERSRIISNGVNVAIVGKPNVGKSSLLNCLLNEEKAIVSSVSGTTRDVVEGQFVLNEILYTIKDTAGIRESKNQIENIGMEKTFEQIKQSEMIIHLIDGTKKEDEFDKLIKTKSKKKIYIKVYNKLDLVDKKDIKNNSSIWISAKNKNIDSLEKKLNSIAKEIDFDSEFVVTNTRQLALIKSAYKNIKIAKKSIEKNNGPEVVIVDLVKAWENLQDIQGNSDNEKLLDTIFKNFCLGK
ncbi:tRNA uridine-5-carboxymethylaminomethyl(34) synthesis GTPase MnmE [[Mycoplasma] collis]|uniref:tRNA uridine-5-carboxymethylaminomethyl(34) synthesis GTPase MnmE n=1 Tax=[Mycoplasma] collis TaxID=2127 RepID=UPI000B260896|nr:tRNA uridine-5-carboxymethylaminomethyl(34) synthesis GTPase MnmE [[Mycoplasma] collis]